MLAQIATIHSKLCDVEKQFGIVFNRNTAVMDQDNNFDLLHLLVDTIVVPTIAPNERILSTVALITPNNKVFICPIVTVQNVSGTAFTNAKVIDSTGTQLQSGTIFPGSEEPKSSGIGVGPSVKDLVVTSTQLPNGDLEVHVEATLDVDAIFVSRDIMHIDFTFVIYGDN
jgi:hypothetical protein